MPARIQLETLVTSVLIAQTPARSHACLALFRFLPGRLGFGDQAPRYPHLLALPVTRGPVFPGVLTPLTLTDPKTIEAVEKLMANGAGGYLGLFLRREADAVHRRDVTTPEVITDASTLYSVGTFAQIQRLTRTAGEGAGEDGDVQHPLAGGPADGDSDGDGTDDGHGAEQPASLLVMPHRRVDLVSVDAVGPPVDVTVSHWDRLTYVRGEDAARDDTIRALCQEVLGTIREVAGMNALFKEQVVSMVPSAHFLDMNDPFRLADFAASLSSGGESQDLQAVLEERDPEQRLHKALVLLSKEREVSRLQKEISAKVEEKMSEAQRKCECAVSRPRCICWCRRCPRWSPRQRECAERNRGGRGGSARRSLRPVLGEGWGWISLLRSAASSPLFSDGASFRITRHF